MVKNTVLLTDIRGMAVLIPKGYILNGHLKTLYIFLGTQWRVYV